MNTPLLAVTPGEPAGIGPEIIVKALSSPELRRTARFVVHGANDLLTLAADRSGIEPFWQRVPADNASLVDEAEGDVIVRDHDHGGSDDGHDGNNSGSSRGKSW